MPAYATLARGGLYKALDTTLGEDDKLCFPRRVISAEISALIADILSDLEARRLEFGQGNLLHFSVQTAVKTGTSNDYRYAWSVGFSSCHTVGV
jgi:penicillin-binding protein 1C